MASSTEIMHADQETIPIVGGGPAPDTRGKQPVVDVTPPRHNNPKQVSEAASSSESTEALMSTIRAAAAEAEAKVIGPRTPLPGNRRWWRRLFPPDPLSSIPVGQPLDAQQERMLIKKALRPMNPWNPKRLAMERQIVRECLHHYNIRNPGNEYEPAPGMVIQYFQFGNGTCWTHGNFVARQKRYGCFSLLPAPRTLFFYEQSYKNGSPGVVTCTPLDEPVTEAYSVRGFPLWWSSRRSGQFDSICKTCNRRFDDPQPGIQTQCACGDSNVEGVCQMCYRRAPVLHPNPGEFAFGC